MDILSALRKWFREPILSSATAGKAVRVRCNRCGEVMTVRINLMNDPSVEYDERGGITGYFCRKVAMGKGLCFQQIIIESKFDSNRRLMEHTVHGGTLFTGEG
jgi:hypothetical protein